MTQVLHLVRTRHRHTSSPALALGHRGVVASCVSLLPWPALSAAGFPCSARHDRRPVGPWRRGNRHSHPERQSAGRPHLLAHSPHRCPRHRHGQARHRCLVRRRSAPRRPGLSQWPWAYRQAICPPPLRRSSSLTPQPWLGPLLSSTTRGVASMLVALLGTLFGCRVLLVAIAETLRAPWVRQFDLTGPPSRSLRARPCLSRLSLRRGRCRS